MPELILASSSPRRSELLRQAGFDFEIHPTDVPEFPLSGESAIQLASRLALKKAQTVFDLLAPRASNSSHLLVLGADTVVACDEQLLGKPADEEDAKRMLRLLSGRTHQVVTGVALVQLGGRTNVAAELTLVTMRAISEEEIARYVARGEPMGKAGGYAIQGYAERWIPRIQGSYSNVVGLPLALVDSMLDGMADGPLPAKRPTRRDSSL